MRDDWGRVSLNSASFCSVCAEKTWSLVTWWHEPQKFVQTLVHKQYCNRICRLLCKHVAQVRNSSIQKFVQTHVKQGLNYCNHVYCASIQVYYYTCQLSRLRRESHACGLKTSISRPLTPADQFLTPDWKMLVVVVLLDTISKNMLTQTHVTNENHV